VGKGTVVHRVLQARPDLMFSISFTTRQPRPGEVDGRHYRFVSDAEFSQLIEAASFLEWAEVFGERYGTPAAEVHRALEAGRDVLLELDIQGARKVRESVPDAILVFLRPPSEQELARRLAARGTESGQALENRMIEARKETAESSWFDHVVVNDLVDEAVAEVLAIIEKTAPQRNEGDSS
jgi:guanylate kinase